MREKYIMNKKQMKKLKRVKLIKKLKNKETEVMLELHKKIFHEMFNDDYLPNLKLKLESQIDTAKKDDDIEQYRYLCSAKYDIDNSRLEVKDKIATIYWKHESPSIYTYDKYSPLVQLAA